MKKHLSTQWILTIAIVVIGGAVLAGEMYLVNWLPGHRERVREEALKPVPYKNEKLGIELQIAAGFNGKTEEFAGGVRITHPKFMGFGPSITITSQPNPDGTFEFDPRALARLDIVQVRLETLALGPAQVHTQQHLSPVLALEPARARV